MTQQENNELRIHITMWMNLKCWKKKDPKQRKCTYDSIYMTLENKINVQKADQWLPGDGG